MMLRDLSLPIADSDAKALALVFDGALAARLAAVHRLHGTTNLVPTPIRLTDGRWMVCADLLTEIHQGGRLHRCWVAADQSVLLDAVEVVPISDVAGLLPRFDYGGQP